LPAEVKQPVLVRDDQSANLAVHHRVQPTLEALFVVTVFGRQLELQHCKRSPEHRKSEVHLSANRRKSGIAATRHTTIKLLKSNINYKYEEISSGGQCGFGQMTRLRSPHGASAL